MSEIVNASLDLIDRNPFRLLKKYPFNQEKLEALQRSIADVGLWEGVIARKAGRRYEIAFGHHRIEAARREKLDKVPLVVRDLDDQQMLQFMGRENGEDFSTSFPILLETWEAAAEFLKKPAIAGQVVQAIDIANLIGWVSPKSSARSGTQLSDLARACNAAHALITGGFLNRDDLQGLAVHAAKQIVERAHSRMEQLEKLGSIGKRPYAEIERAKHQVAKGAKRTADQVRAGKVAPDDVRSRVDINAYRFAAEAKHISPLFAPFAKALVDGLDKMLNTDATAEKFEEIKKALSKITLAEDVAAIKKIDFALEQLEGRCETWRKRLTPGDKKILKLADMRGGAA